MATSHGSTTTEPGSLGVLAAIPEVPGLSREAFLRALPSAYFERMDADDIVHHYHLVAMLVPAASREKTLHAQGDVEDFRIHVFDTERLQRTLRAFQPAFGSRATLLRIAAKGPRPRSDDDELDGGFIIATFFADPLGASRARPIEPPTWESVRDRFVDGSGRVRRHLHLEAVSKGSVTTLSIQCVNSSQRTVWRNVLEVLERHRVFPAFLEAWHQMLAVRGVRSLDHVELQFDHTLDVDTMQSIERDLDRYLQAFLEPMSVFDLIGPVMVGPSSSHTAGANRIGRLARNIILALQSNGTISDVSSLEVRLLGSFRDTGVGHRTPAAIGGGLCGLGSDDGTMLDRGEPARMSSDPPRIGSSSPRFLGYTRGSADDDARYADEGNGNIAEIVLSTDRGNICITGFSIGGGNVEIRYVGERLDDSIDGTRPVWLEGMRVVCVGGPCPSPSAARVETLERSPNDAPAPQPAPFNTFEELLEWAESSSSSLVDVVYDHERNVRGTSREQASQAMQRQWAVMRDAVQRGRRDGSRSLLGLSGGDGRAMAGWLEGHVLFDNLYGRALAYATAVSELNARSGVVVACPTAGSCGILPGVLCAYQEQTGADDVRVVEALLVSGLMGVILFDDVSTAGADYGCQAEVGAAAAVAASALAHLEGGGADAVVHAFVLAIKNCMGLVCDPVAGLVEVPCVKRNGIYTSVAISAAVMALSGVRSFISPDEVVLAVREVGERLHRDYKETAGGGLAQTRDGKGVALRFRHEVERWFAKPSGE